MFTASNGAYRKTKIVIDWINIILSVAMLIMATVIFIVPGNFDFLIPGVLFCGTVINGLHVVKHYFKFERRAVMWLFTVTLILLVLTVVSAIAVW
jgi:hypothetical protein